MNERIVWGFELHDERRYTGIEAVVEQVIQKREEVFYRELGFRPPSSGSAIRLLGEPGVMEYRFDGPTGRALFVRKEGSYRQRIVEMLSETGESPEKERIFSFYKDELGHTEFNDGEADF